MGTSGAYGGSAGWSSVASDTDEWIASDGETDEQPPAGDDGPPQEGDPEVDRRPAESPIPPPVTKIVANIARRLTGARGGAGGALAGGGGGGGGGGRRTSGPIGGTRSGARAAASAGRAAAGVYALRTGATAPLAELGLTLGELSGLTRWQQAQRLQDAASGPSGGVAESEVRRANAEFIMWALEEADEASPSELAARWIVEYVWQVWVTEAGPRLLATDRARYEEEMRAGLQALVSSDGLPDDRPLTAADFEAAINRALTRLGRIEGET